MNNYSYMNYNISIIKSQLFLGRPLSQEIKSKVFEFYNRDDVSVNLPGMKDFISIRNDEGQRQHVQKKLILCNLKELYELFKTEYSDYQLGFSTFASLRPKHCVLAGSSGTHTICVCAIHQNIKLMILGKYHFFIFYFVDLHFLTLNININSLILGSDLAALTRDWEEPLNNYNDCFQIIMCENPTPNCHFNKCEMCPGISELKNVLEELFNDNDIDTVSYKHWISNPRCTLETLMKDSSEFIEVFCDNIMDLLPHDFIAKEQSKFMKSVKDSLQEDEFLAVCDFAENYAFIIQNAAPGFHWNNNQCTIFPVVIYFKQNNELTHKSLVIMSDCNNHDAIAVYVYLKRISDFIKTLSQQARKIYYFSDGAPQQFKNFKNFDHIYHHKQDFGIDAEWHFFATAHGKGPCDGVGGTVKRLAARASLQRALDRQITTAEELYEWATEPHNLDNIQVEFSRQIDYLEVKEKLEIRYSKIKSIPGTQKLHAVIPSTDGTLIVKEYSGSNSSRECKIFKRQRK